jgi:myo-inositol-hexaphosphate 3-phosphohydrolase
MKIFTIYLLFVLASLNLVSSYADPIGSTQFNSAISIGNNMFITVKDEPKREYVTLYEVKNNKIEIIDTVVKYHHTAKGKSEMTFLRLNINDKTKLNK